MPQLRRGEGARPSVRALRRLALAAAFLVGLLPTPASGAERGSIEGRVVNGATGKPQSGVEVTLLGGREDGSGGLTEDVREHVTTGDDGRYVFTGLQTGADRIYTVDATFRGGLFAGGAIRLPSDTARAPAVKTTLRVWPTITDPRAIVVQRNDLFIVSGDEGTSVIESYKIVNTSDRAYIGRGGSTDADSGDPVPTLSFPLPTRAMSSGVQILNSDLDVPELIETGTGLGITTAVPPDETSITFVYNLRLETGQVELSRRALYPILNFEVFTESPYVVESDRLAEKGTEEISGTTYRRFSSAGTIESGDPIPVTVRAEAGSDSALIAGAIVAAVALLGAVAFALVRRRTRTRAPKRGASEGPATREQLLTAIAKLDLEWRDREIDERSYNARRAALKRRLTDLEPATQREPTP